MAKMNPQNLIMLVLIVGLILVVGIYILSQFQTQFDDSTLVTTNVVYDTTDVWVNSSGNTLQGVGGTNWDLVSFTLIDTDDNSTIAATQYTITNGVITNATETSYSQVAFTYTYTTGYDTSDEASISAGDLVDSLAAGTPWLTIIIVVGFSVIVLVVISEGLNKAKKENPVGSVY